MCSLAVSTQDSPAVEPRSNPSKQLGSETEAKFSRLQDVVPNVTKTEPNLFKYFGTTL